jgi:hypothetical protein
VPALAVIAWGCAFGIVHVGGWVWMSWSMWQPVAEMARELDQEPAGFTSFLLEVMRGSGVLWSISLIATLCVVLICGLLVGLSLSPLAISATVKWRRAHWVWAYALLGFFLVLEVLAWV